ncbi:MAG: guanylate kinase [Lachnospiraceae bacterium]|nr:guanylate kinase [Lachnospiraceae bacterium]
MDKKGILIVISGFSGVGKGTLVKELLTRYPDEYALSISATSRAPRENEEEGREYFFKSREEFLEMIDAGRLLEHAEYNGNFYGTPKDYVLSQMNEGKNVILEIEVQGGLQVRKQFPESMLLYIVPPDAKELLRRLVTRGTETLDVIKERMERSLQETDYICYYDRVLVNDDFETCLSELRRTILEEQSRIDGIHHYIEKIRTELRNLEF